MSGEFLENSRRNIDILTGKPVMEP